MDDPVLLEKNILERFSLHGCTALITGGGQGIGRAFAHALGEAGAKVAIVDLNCVLAASGGRCNPAVSGAKNSERCPGGLGNPHHRGK